MIYCPLQLRPASLLISGCHQLAPGQLEASWRSALGCLVPLLPLPPPLALRLLPPPPPCCCLASSFLASVSSLAGGGGGVGRRRRRSEPRLIGCCLCLCVHLLHMWGKALGSAVSAAWAAAWAAHRRHQFDSQPPLHTCQPSGNGLQTLKGKGTGNRLLLACGANLRQANA